MRRPVKQLSRTMDAIEREWIAIQRHGATVIELQRTRCGYRALVRLPRETFQPLVFRGNGKTPAAALHDAHAKFAASTA